MFEEQCLPVINKSDTSARHLHNYLIVGEIGHSRLQYRIFPSALNRNRDASFPPIAWGCSCSFVCFIFFILLFPLATALFDITGLLLNLHISADVSESYKQV